MENIMSTIREYTLENGLHVRIGDRTTRYFGEYHTVEMELEAFIKTDASLFHTPQEYEKIRYLAGDGFWYRRTLKQRGVYETDLDEIKAMLIYEFEANSLPYLRKQSFLRKFILINVVKKQRALEIERLRSKFNE